MRKPGNPAGRRSARALAAAAALVAAVCLPAGSAAADTQGNAADIFDCGALRDVPDEWTAVAGAGWCSSQQGQGTWGYSYVLTSPTDVHYATWDFDGGVEEFFTLAVEAYIPGDTGAEAEYDYQVCGSSSWVKLGDLNQYNDSGWYTPGTIPAYTVVCAVREHNVGSASYNLGEDALGFYSSQIGED
jgi:hypothetical protein